MAQQISGPAYIVRTARLVVRCWQPADAPLLQAALAQSIDHLRPWMPWAHDEPSELQAMVDRLRRFRGMFDLAQDFVYGIFDAQESEVLGSTGLHTRLGPDAREIGYWINAAHINSGIATEASSALTRVAFEVDRVKRVEIHCDPRNVRSAAVPRKLGFTHEATLRKRTAFRDEPLRDQMIWTLLVDEFAASPAAQAHIEAFDAAGRRIV